MAKRVILQVHYGKKSNITGTLWQKELYYRYIMAKRVILQLHYGKKSNITATL